MTPQERLAAARKTMEGDRGGDGRTTYREYTRGGKRVVEYEHASDMARRMNSTSRARQILELQRFGYAPLGEVVERTGCDFIKLHLAIAEGTVRSYTIKHGGESYRFAHIADARSLPRANRLGKRGVEVR